MWGHWQYLVSKDIPWADLKRVFGLNELSLSEWVAHLVSIDILREVDTSITLSAVFSEKVLGTLARCWANVRVQETAEIIKMLQGVSCIPTKKGMSLPNEAYLPRVDLFDDCEGLVISGLGAQATDVVSSACDHTSGKG